MKINATYFILPIILVFIGSHLFAQCGKERWAVKTLIDKDTNKINFIKKVSTTVCDQTKLPKPGVPIGTNLARLDSEKTYYTVDCYLQGFVLEADKDIHMVIKDIKTDCTMIAELPSPDCSEIKVSSHYKQIVTARHKFESAFGKPPKKYKKLSKPKLIHLEGIGFHDKIHGQKGIPKNGREIHPVLVLEIK